MFFLLLFFPPVRNRNIIMTEGCNISLFWFHRSLLVNSCFMALFGERMFVNTLLPWSVLFVFMFAVILKKCIGNLGITFVMREKHVLPVCFKHHCIFLSFFLYNFLFFYFYFFWLHLSAYVHNLYIVPRWGEAVSYCFVNISWWPFQFQMWHELHVCLEFSFFRILEL